MLAAFLSVVCGMVLDTVTRGRREMKRLAYLQTPATQDLLETTTGVDSARARSQQHLGAVG
jgi:hypothetical protein